MDKNYLSQLLHYDPSTGVFSWKVNRRGGAMAGKEAGSITSKGYRSIRVFNSRYGAHRLAFLFMTGFMPASDIDHINGNRADNRWSNLRDVSRSVNMQNLHRPHKDNATGFLGVSKFRNKYQASIRANGTTTRIGLYDCPQMAHAAYIASKRALHTGNTL
jgi:hypothetical protein